MTKDFEEYFNEHFRFTCCGPNLWRVYNKTTHEAASPIYNNKDAAKYYVMQELKQQAEDAVYEMLGGDNAVTSLYDVDSLRSGLSPSVKRDGTEEEF